MNYFCNYSIIRFLPYPETGEFVNVGVVLLASNGDFLHKVESKRQRVTRFFNMLEPRIYIRAREEVEQELARLSMFFSKHKESQSIQLSTFKHLIHPRETMIRFSDPGTMAAESPQQALDTLFEHYIKLSFANKEYEEKILERQLGQLLTVANIKQRYKEYRLGTDAYPVKFPFVLLDDGKAAQAIKPIHLAHDEPAKISEHGDAWIAKIRRLHKAKRLAKDTIFLASAPPANKHRLFDAYTEIVKELSDFETVRVLNKENSDQELIAAIKKGVPASTH